jgi:hypothetical protein
MPYWWPAVVFGWPAIILSVVLAVTGAASGRPSSAWDRPHSHFLSASTSPALHLDGTCRSFHTAGTGWERICGSPDGAVGRVLLAALAAILLLVFVSVWFS